MHVNSSIIAEIEHTGQTLTVTFNSGRVYTYDGVSKELFEQFANAESKGKFFHENINYRYNYTRLK